MKNGIIVQQKTEILVNLKIYVNCKIQQIIGKDSYLM